MKAAFAPPVGQRPALWATFSRALSGGFDTDQAHLSDHAVAFAKRLRNMAYVELRNGLAWTRDGRNQRESCRAVARVRSEFRYFAATRRSCPLRPGGGVRRARICAARPACAGPALRFASSMFCGSDSAGQRTWRLWA